MKPISKQNGAVLVFTMVMLLLLTLAAVTMIQQNKQQLTMANNTRLQNQIFAKVESELSNKAEPYISAKRQQGEPKLQICNPPTDELDYGTKLDFLPNNVVKVSQVDIDFWRKAPPPTTTTSLTSTVVTENYCFTAAGGLFRCGPEDDPDETGCDNWNNNHKLFTGEIYTLETITYEGTTQRKVESKYSVSCQQGYK